MRPGSGERPARPGAYVGTWPVAYMGRSAVGLQGIGQQDEA